MRFLHIRRDNFCCAFEWYATSERTAFPFADSPSSRTWTFPRTDCPFVTRLLFRPADLHGSETRSSSLSRGACKFIPLRCGGRV